MVSFIHFLTYGFIIIAFKSFAYIKYALNFFDYIFCSFIIFFTYFCFYLCKHFESSITQEFNVRIFFLQCSYYVFATLAAFVIS